MIQIDDITWQSNDGLITFKNMDCNEFMAQCKENEFDLNLSDPPYGIDIKQRIFKDGKNWDSEIPNKEVFQNILRTSINQIIWGGNYFIENLYSTKCFLIWDKKITQTHTFSMAEFAWTSFNTNSKCFYQPPPGDRGFYTIDETRIHPTQKSIDLYKWQLDLYTKENDTILDCFGGSMSNAIACHMKRRKLTIIELDVDYFKSALNRFEIYERQVEDIKEFGYAKTKINAQNPVLF